MESRKGDGRSDTSSPTRLAGRTDGMLTAARAFVKQAPKSIVVLALSSPELFAAVQARDSGLPVINGNSRCWSNERPIVMLSPKDSEDPMIVLSTLRRIELDLRSQNRLSTRPPNPRPRLASGNRSIGAEYVISILPDTNLASSILPELRSAVDSFTGPGSIDLSLLPTVRTEVLRYGTLTRNCSIWLPMQSLKAQKEQGRRRDEESTTSPSRCREMNGSSMSSHDSAARPARKTSPCS